MTSSARITLAFGSIGILAAATFNASFSDEPPVKEPLPSPVQEARRAGEQDVFMRGKLDASSQILEGLVSEDSDLVAKGARQLIEMSSAEQWQVRHDTVYRQHSRDFQQAARKLLESAEKENFDAIALKWIDTTLKCIECHKSVRGARIAVDSDSTGQH